MSGSHGASGARPARTAGETAAAAAKRARRAWATARALAVGAVRAFFDDHCPQLAAGIAYWVLFSIFPLAILLVAVAGLVLREEAVRTSVVDTFLRNVPLTGEGRADLERLLNGVAEGSGALTVVGLLALVWTASGLMTMVRTALNVVWDRAKQRPFLRGKAVDVLLVAAVGVFVGLSVGLTIAVRLVKRLAERLAELLGPLGFGADLAVTLVELVLPFLVTFAVFLFVYRVVPAARTALADVWPGALVAAVVFEAAKHAFTLYLDAFGNYNAVYGSLGAVVAFLFFVYLSANVFLLGAEVAVERRRIRAEGRAASESRPRRGLLGVLRRA